MSELQQSFAYDLALLLIALIVTAILFFIAGRYSVGKSRKDKEIQAKLDTAKLELNDCKNKFEQLRLTTSGGKIIINNLKETSAPASAPPPPPPKDIQIEQKKDEFLPVTEPQKSTIETIISPEVTPTSFDETIASTIMGNKMSENDLKIIEGIGPKIESILNENGIMTWKQLSQTKADKISEMLIAAGGATYKVHDPTTWPQQAEYAADGNWQELKKWQEDMKGGRIS